jgi:hypothetical protein
MAGKLELTVGEDSEFLKFKWDDFVSWCEGKLIISIGRGEFHDTLYNCLRFAADWRIYHARSNS